MTALMSSSDSVSEVQLVFCEVDAFLLKEKKVMRRNMEAKHMAKLKNTPL